MCLRSSVPGACAEGATAPTQAALSPTGSVPEAAPAVSDAQKSPGPGVVAQASGAASLSAFPAVAIGALAVLTLAALL
jgi:hypothetical protein